MVGKYQAYEEYKDTNYDWISSVPAHWNEKTIRSITTLSTERNGERTDLELLSVYREYGVIKKASRDDNHNVESQDLANYKFVDEGYLVLNKMKMWQGSLGVSQYRGIVSPAYIVCKLSKEVNASYIHYLLRSVHFKTIYNRISYGVRVGQWDMRYDDFKGIRLYIPPITEQNKIVKYLNRRLIQIDNFIKTKIKLISLLKEQKKAIIYSLITQGLNKQENIKLSNIGWVNEFPAHWTKSKLKHLGSFKSGDSITSLSIEEDGKYPVYGGNGLRGYINEFTHDGEFLLIGRQGALCGNVHLVKGKFWASEHAIVTVPKPNVDIEWFNLLIEVMDLNQYSRSAAQPGLSVEKIINVPTFLPPREEQKAIVKSVESSVKKIEKSIELAEKEVKLIKEYRERFISDVVTGQIDIRSIELRDLEGFEGVMNVATTVELEEEFTGNEEVEV